MVTQNLHRRGPGHRDGHRVRHERRHHPPPRRHQRRQPTASRRVTGNIAAGGQPLANVRVSITGGKYAYTDADGNYALAGVTAGSQTLTATLNGFTLTPSFTNPLGVVAGTNTANWTAAGSTFVTLAKTADATEGGANGSFTLTRTGDTAADLVVRVSPATGTAALTTDYTFTPAYVTDGGYRTFTIPAGQASLAVAVAAVNDTAAGRPGDDQPASRLERHLSPDRRQRRGDDAGRQRHHAADGRRHRARSLRGGRHGRPPPSCSPATARPPPR